MANEAKLLIEHDVEDSDEPSVELPGGVYNYERSTHLLPERLEPTNLRQDSYHRLPGVFDPLSEDINNFVKGESIYRQLGFQYRRGILLFGSPGNGKTSLIREILKTHFTAKDLVIFADRVPSRHFVRVMRETLAQRFKVIVFEELAATLKGSALDQTLAFLDGELSLDRCLILATTNYPEQLPGNIVDRPSRFDKLYRLSDPNENGRKILLQNYLGMEIETQDIEATEGLSAAALREVCLLVKLRSVSISEAAKQLRNHRDLVKREFGNVKEVGLTLSKFDLDDLYE